MVNIEKALYLYLTSLDDITAHVGSYIYNARRPRQAGSVAVTLRSLGHEGVYTLQTEVTAPKSIIDLSVWSTGHVASQAMTDAYEAIRKRVSGYRGDWGDVFIHGCTLDTGSGAVIPEAIDPAGSDYWTFRKIMNLEVTHQQPATTWS